MGGSSSTVMSDLEYLVDRTGSPGVISTWRLRLSTPLAISHLYLMKDAGAMERLRRMFESLPPIALNVDMNFHA